MACRGNFLWEAYWSHLKPSICALYIDKQQWLTEVGWVKQQRRCRSAVQRLAWRHVHRSPCSKLIEWTVFNLLHYCFMLFHELFFQTCVINSCASCFFASATSGVVRAVSLWENWFVCGMHSCYLNLFPLYIKHRKTLSMTYLCSRTDLCIYLYDFVWHLSIDTLDLCIIAWIYLSPCSFW